MKGMKIHGSVLTIQLLATKSKSTGVALSYNKPFEIAPKLLVTLIKANHCPGSAMFLFESLVTHTLILCTGDFKFERDSPECVGWEMLRCTKLYIDTTYLATKSCFPTQSEAIQYAVTETRKVFRLFRTKVICQTYTVGKERLFEALAENLGIKFHPAGKPRLLTLREIYGDNFTKYYTAEDNDQGLLDPLYSSKRQQQLTQIYTHFEHLVVIYATGWQGKCSAQTKGKLTVIKTPYTEHCDYSQLVDFIHMVRPAEIESIISEEDTAAVRKLLEQGPPKPAESPLLKQLANAGRRVFTGADVVKQQQEIPDQNQMHQQRTYEEISISD